MRIDLTAIKDQPPILAIEGSPAPEVYPLRWKDSLDLPFTLFWLADERLYDVELWTNGTLIGKVPPKSPAVDAIYDNDESGAAQELPQPMAPTWWSAQDGQPHSDRLKGIRREIDASPGQHAWLQWHGLGLTLAVHDRNTLELAALLDAIETDQEIALELFQNVRPPIVRDELLGQLDQRLHNFAASAASLVDHTRRLFRGYAGTHLASEYEQRKEALRVTPVVGFVKDLRNFLLHRSLPFIGHTVSLGERMNAPKARMHLSVAQLNEWDGWNRPAKTYLDTAGEAVLLSDVPRDYDAQVKALYDWVFEQFRGMHSADTHALNALIDEYNWVLSAGQKGRPRTSSASGA